MDKKQYEESLRDLLDWSRQPYPRTESSTEAIEQVCSVLEKMLGFQVAKEFYALNEKNIGEQS